MKLTRREVEDVLLAAEMIELDDEIYCCAALALAEGDFFPTCSPLAQKYTRFYHRSVNKFWDFTGCDAKEARVLLLLWFAEVCGA